VQAFDGLHQRRGRCLRQVQSLALRDRYRAGIRAYRDDDRDADMVETGDVAEPGDPHPLGEGTVAGERLRRGDDAVSAAPKRLGQRRLGSRGGDTQTGERQHRCTVRDITIKSYRGERILVRAWLDENCGAVGWAMTPREPAAC